MTHDDKSNRRCQIALLSSNQERMKCPQRSDPKLPQTNHYTANVDQLQIITSSLTLRSGAGIGHNKIGLLAKGTVVDVLGKIGEWYVIKTTDDKVGCINGNSACVTSYAATANSFGQTPALANVSIMQLEMLGYINAARIKTGQQPLVLDKVLCYGAYLKSKDMLDNKYFGHNSPVYGTPFNMMKQLNIVFTQAGENIAKHTSIKGAHDGLMNSPSHRENILRPVYKKLGLGFIRDGRYLYITQWFTRPWFK